LFKYVKNVTLFFLNWKHALGGPS